MDNQEIRVENKDVVFKFNSKGGSLTQVQLKGYSNYKEEPLFIVNDNQKINLNFQTKNGYEINTSDYNFEIEQFERGNVKIVIMKLLISEFQSIAFEYKKRLHD
jgi:YidC/Oxa1 family membrane protein insertase